MFDWVKEDLRDFGKYTESSQNISENSHSDISFIGSGLSSTYTLIELIKQLDNRTYTDKQKHDNLPLKIHVFEKVRCQEAVWAELGPTWASKRTQNGAQEGAKTEQKKRRIMK